MWSPERTHEALVSMDMYLEAQRVSRARRTSPDSTAEKRKDANRTYLFRSCVKCTVAGCGRRMFGKARKGLVYYRCQPKPGYAPEGHPPTVSVREDALLEACSRFFADYVFCADRGARLAGIVSEAERAALKEVREQEARLVSAPADMEARSELLVRSLEDADDPAGELTRRVHARLDGLAQERRDKEAELAAVREARPPIPDEGLLGVLPVTSADLARVPEGLLRPLFDAFRLEALVDKTRGGRADVSVTLLPETVDSVQAVAGRALTSVDSGSALDRAEFSPVCLAAPAGFEPATPALGEPCSVP